MAATLTLMERTIKALDDSLNDRPFLAFSYVLANPAKFNTTCIYQGCILNTETGKGHYVSFNSNDANLKTPITLDIICSLHVNDVRNAFWYITNMLKQEIQNKKNYDYDSVIPAVKTAVKQFEEEAQTQQDHDTVLALDISLRIFEKEAREHYKSIIAYLKNFIGTFNNYSYEELQEFIKNFPHIMGNHIMDKDYLISRIINFFSEIYCLLDKSFAATQFKAPLFVKDYAKKRLKEFCFNPLFSEAVTVLRDGIDFTDALRLSRLSTQEGYTEGAWAESGLIIMEDKALVERAKKISQDENPEEFKKLCEEIENKFKSCKDKDGKELPYPNLQPKRWQGQTEFLHCLYYLQAIRQELMYSFCKEDVSLCRIVFSNSNGIETLVPFTFNVRRRREREEMDYKPKACLPLPLPLPSDKGWLGSVHYEMELPGNQTLNWLGSLAYYVKDFNVVPSRPFLEKFQTFLTWCKSNYRSVLYPALQITEFAQSLGIVGAKENFGMGHTDVSPNATAAAGTSDIKTLSDKGIANTDAATSAAAKVATGTGFSGGSGGASATFTPAAKAYTAKGSKLNKDASTSMAVLSESSASNPAVLMSAAAHTAVAAPFASSSTNPASNTESPPGGPKH